MTVTSDGETCNGFLGRPGQPGTANDTATIDPAPAVPIVIVNANDAQGCQGTDLSRQTPIPSIYAGEPVDLKACLTSLQPGEAIASATWTVNGNVVSHYFPNPDQTSLQSFTPPSDCVDQINGASADPGCEVGIFNWICNIANADVCNYPGQVTAVFAYNLDGGNGASQTVTFNLMGPGNTGTPITVNPDGGTATEQVTVEDLGEGPTLAVGPMGITVVSTDGSDGQSVGLVLMASAQLPTDPDSGEMVGEFQWARVLSNPSTISFVQGSAADSQVQPDLGPGAFSCSLVKPTDLNPEVVTNDASSVAQKIVPKDLLLVTDGVGLRPHGGEGAFERSETAYLFWIPPNLDPTCVGCISAIPLGAVSYHYSGAATNSLDPKQGTQGWTINPGCATALGGFKLAPGRGGTDATAFPTWKAASAVQSCSSVH